ncbi:MAG TPA: phosphoenolpyruvate--protein phosphotransferase [Euzebyales bacterium]|nr:phosphoenolpyruvate--protein phosphotransferase [Euzebyales bacterium]
MSTRLEGRAASPGVALAPAFVVRPAHARDAAAEAVSREAPADPEKERARAEAALAQTEERLGELADEMRDQLGDEADIFLAHADFAGDPEILDRVTAAIAEGSSAEAAVVQAFDSFRDLLAASADEYLAGRAADIDDVRDQVLDVLAGREGAPVPVERAVVVAAELTPSQTARLPRDLIAAVVCETGSPTSHAAILSRALGIPAVVGVAGLLDAIAEGDLIAVDGRAGAVRIAPDEREQEDIRVRVDEERRHRERLSELRDEPGRTADGRHVELAANVGGAEDLDTAREHGAEGSGLVRTEFLFQQATHEPSIAEQEAFYRRVLAAFPGQRVVFRTMDVGADKPLPFVVRDPEENPALGVRGLRLGLARPDLLRNQLRALLRARDVDGAAEGERQPAGGQAAQGRLAIMFPLVSTADEVRRARVELERAAEMEQVALDGVEVGIMVEVPAAALSAHRIAPLVDFFSVGTNDLLQYLFAADRLVADLAMIPDAADPDVLRLLGQVIEVAHEHGIWVGVCGEAAADLPVAAALVGLGADELSMTPVAIPEVKDMLRRNDGAALRRVADEALGATDAAAARDLITGALGP